MNLLDRKNQPQQSESLLNISNVSKSFYGQGQGYSSSVPQKREYCKEHKEEVTYFCFDCMVRCVCSECVIHGAHKNHDVLNVKRAYPLVVEKVLIKSNIHVNRLKTFSTMLLPK